MERIYAEVVNGVCVRKFWAAPAEAEGRPTVVIAEPYMEEGVAVAVSLQAWMDAEALKSANAARLAAIDDVIVGDATIAALKAMDAAAFDTWWAANVTTQAQANNVLKRVTRAVIRRVV